MPPLTPLILDTIQSIQPIPPERYRLGREAWDRLTKPKGSLGRLETLGTRFVAITGTIPKEFPESMIFTLAADHGVTEEGVSAYPSSVTGQMVANFLKGGAAINVMAGQVGARIRVVDMGVDADLEHHPDLWVRKVGRGTKNFSRCPAMTQEQAVKCIEEGIRLAQTAYAEGVRVIGTGEMGIGNTTSSSAITAVMTQQPVPDVTGYGAGIDEAGLKNKIRVIEQALRLHEPIPSDPLDVLSKVGGFEIGGLAGLILGGAAVGVPVILDGFIAGAAMLLAFEMAPDCGAYVISSHQSAEQGHAFALKKVGLKPLFDLGLRLGEGTGASLAIGLLRSSLACLTNMATFDSAGIDEQIQKSVAQS